MPASKPRSRPQRPATAPSTFSASRKSVADQEQIVRRWNAPPQWGYLKENPNELVALGGELRGGIEEGLTYETFQRIKLGYMCLICKEPHEKPFPELCALCRFPM